MNIQEYLPKLEKEVRRMRPVLIVEDEAIMRESLRDWLREEGYEVETAEAGEEALQKIGEREFSVAVLDLRLPGKNGLEVLREAKARNPKLKGIIITAYPSVDTAVEAMKMGAIDYLVKPFSPDALEQAIQKVLGPVQVAIRPEEKRVEPTVVKEIAEVQVPTEEEEVQEILPITEKDVPVHFEQGKAYFKIGQYREALKEFQSILHVAPGHIENRIWLRKTKEQLVKQQAKPLAVEIGVAETPEVRQCIWAKAGIISDRLCLRNYDCLACEFDQAMQDRMSRSEAPEIQMALERLKELPAPQRVCRYALKGDVSYRLCTQVFRCATCEFDQLMQDSLERKLSKLAARREALRKREQKAELWPG